MSVCHPCHLKVISVSVISTLLCQSVTHVICFFHLHLIMSVCHPFHLKVISVSVISTPLCQSVTHVICFCHLHLVMSICHPCHLCFCHLHLVMSIYHPCHLFLSSPPRYVNLLPMSPVSVISTPLCQSVTHVICFCHRHLVMSICHSCHLNVISVSVLVITITLLFCFYFNISRILLFFSNFFLHFLCACHIFNELLNFYNVFYDVLLRRL